MTATTTISDADRRTLFSRFFELLCRRAPTLIASGYDCAVYLFIADRSLPFGKLSKDIPDRWFLDGVTGKGNTRGHCAGLSMKRAQLYKSRKALKGRGLVRDQKVGRCKRYAVALEPVWVLLSTKERELFAPLLTIVDPDWQADEQVEKVHSVDVQQVHSVDPHTEKRSPFRTITEEITGEAVASLCVIPEFPVERGQTKTEAGVAAASPKVTALVAKRAARAAEHNGGALFDGFAAAARETWVEAGPLPLPTGKQIGRLRNLSKSWTHEGVTFLEFLEWTAANWRGVWASKMTHIPDPKVAELFSEYPSVDTLLIFHKAFRDSYDRRDTQKIRASLTRRDKLIRERMFKGWTQADAERDADELLSREKVREDLDARANELAKVARRLQSKENDLDTRIALGRARLAMKPVALTKPQAKIRVTHEIEDLPPLVSAWPEWKDPMECSCAALMSAA